jgi:hypothetical protein
MAVENWPAGWFFCKLLRVSLSALVTQAKVSLLMNRNH